jgi:hypothetical protein
MKRRLLIFALLSLLCVTMVFAYRYRCHLLPCGEVSDVYTRYKDTPGIMADYIRRFPLNDTLTVAVTLLQATDSASWASLLHLLGKSDEAISDMLTFRGMEKMMFAGGCTRGHPELPEDPDLAKNEVIIFYPYKLEVAVIHTLTADEFKTVVKRGYWGEIEL